MAPIELHLDPQTLERARRLAEARHCTIEDLVGEVLKVLGSPQESGRSPDGSHSPPPNDPFLGLFADEPELMDQVMESVYQARAQHPLRLSDGQGPS